MSFSKVFTSIGTIVTDVIWCKNFYNYHLIFSLNKCIIISVFNQSSEIFSAGEILFCLIMSVFSNEKIKIMKIDSF